MNRIIEFYTLKEDSIALVPVKNEDYKTIVYTSSGKKYVKMSPIEIIEKSCLRDVTTYEGKKKAMLLLTGFKHKVPILIDKVSELYSFPTISPSNEECIWFVYRHIKGFKKNDDPGKTGKQSITVYFSNDEEQIFEVSYFSMQQQYYRTAVCESRINAQDRNGDVY